MTIKHFLSICVFVAGVSVASSGFAHVTIEQPEAMIGGPTKITFRVPHGCDEQPTVKLRALIPEGFIAAKPMPKAGWTLEISQGAYAKSHDYFHGAKLSEGATEISWKGNLPSEYYDEFVVSAFIASHIALAASPVMVMKIWSSGALGSSESIGGAM